MRILSLDPAIGSIRIDHHGLTSLPNEQGVVQERESVHTKQKVSV